MAHVQTLQPRPAFAKLAVRAPGASARRPCQVETHKHGDRTPQEAHATPRQADTYATPTHQRGGTTNTASSVVACARAGGADMARHATHWVCQTRTVAQRGNSAAVVAHACTRRDTHKVPTTRGVHELRMPCTTCRLNRTSTQAHGHHRARHRASRAAAIPRGDYPKAQPSSITLHCTR